MTATKVVAVMLGIVRRKLLPFLQGECMFSSASRAAWRIRAAAILSTTAALFCRDISAASNTWSAAEVDNLSSHSRMGTDK